jgi:elongator complex protein 3
VSRAYRFTPQSHEQELVALIGELDRLEEFDTVAVDRLLRQYPKEGRGFFSKSEIIQGFRHFHARHPWQHSAESFAEKLRKKPIRTLSGVAPVTVLTKPFPCPGRCIFCPSDVRMPKSYLSDEPGAQRAAQHQFDPYTQTLSRLTTYHHNGHPADKVELIILGGTWSYYPEDYQVWFVKRCFDALNDFTGQRENGFDFEPPPPAIDFRELAETVDGRTLRRNYNSIVTDFAALQPAPSEPDEQAGWDELGQVQQRNETAEARCVGLVVETRPDHLEPEEVLRLRRLGTTKVQIGYQSLSDRVLELNHRGHDVAATRRAMRLLREAGFKIHAHWMPNLYGSSPREDVEDFERIFSDPDFRPDELKIYPCSLIESAELMSYFESGEWRPYSHDELLEVLIECLQKTPEYCRVTRVIRDIPGDDIVVGNKMTNLRQVADEELRHRGLVCRDIRNREVRHRPVAEPELELRVTEYDTSVGREVFFQYATREDRIAAFLRLSLPDHPGSITELEGSAIIREVHVYGLLVSIGDRQDGRSQHLGLGRSLVQQATETARTTGFENLAVISSVGTREYYRGLGFADGPLYQHLEIGDTRNWGHVSDS